MLVFVLDDVARGIPGVEGPGETPEKLPADLTLGAGAEAGGSGAVACAGVGADSKVRPERAVPIADTAGVRTGNGAGAGAGVGIGADCVGTCANGGGAAGIGSCAGGGGAAGAGAWTAGGGVGKDTGTGIDTGISLGGEGQACGSVLRSTSVKGNPGGKLG